jgi:hypothetical protein
MDTGATLITKDNVGDSITARDAAQAEAKK